MCLEEVVDRLLECVKGVRIRCVVMDKEFYNVGVLNRIEGHGLHYLVPIIRKESINLLYWLCTITGQWKWGYSMGVATKERKQVTGYFHEYRLGDYAGFITNRDMKTDTAERLFELYSQRWNIENGFKEAEDYKINTTSKNHAYRLLLYVVSHLLVNIQNIVRATRFRVRYYEMQDIIQLALDPNTPRGEHEITKRLTITL
jgi:IS4 transposase